MDKETLDYVVKLEVNNIKNIVFPTHNGKGVYVKVPLGNTEIFNKHGFRLDAAGIYERFNKNIGSPFVIRKFKDGKFVHPVASFTDNDANYRYQEQFNVGELAYVYDKPDQNGTWYGLYYTEDQPTVKKLQNYTESYQKGELPLEYSIAVFGSPDKEGHGRTISNFEITHGALVDDPAWKGSYVKGVCSGDMGQCKGALATASTGHDCETKCDCPICKLNLNNSYQLSVASKSNDMSSQQQEPKQTDTKTETKKEEKSDSSPLSNLTEIFTKKIDEGFNNLKKEVNKDSIQQEQEKEKEVTKDVPKKEEKKEVVKDEKFDWDKVDITKHPKFQEITNRLDDVEKRERSTAIAESLLNYEDFFKHKNDGKEVDEDLFNETVKFWTDTKLKIEDFNKIKKYTYDIVKKHYDIIKNPQKQQVTKTEEPKAEPKVISTASMKNDYEYNAAFKNQNKEEETNSELLPYWKRSNGSSSIVNNRNIL
jgi:hypothetical protein